MLKAVAWQGSVDAVLLGIVPKAANGFGDIARAADMYGMTEALAIMQTMQQANTF